MTLGFNKTDVNVEALPVVSEFINNGKGGVEVVEIIEYEGKQAVNARELHQKLGSKSDFSNWIFDIVFINSKKCFLSAKTYIHPILAR